MSKRTTYMGPNNEWNKELNDDELDSVRMPAGGDPASSGSILDSQLAHVSGGMGGDLRPAGNAIPDDDLNSVSGGMGGDLKPSSGAISDDDLDNVSGGMGGDLKPSSGALS